MKTNSTITTWECDHPGCKQKKTTAFLPSDWTESPGSFTFCPKHSITKVSNEDKSKILSGFNENLEKFIKESNEIVSERSKLHTRFTELTKKLVLLSEKYGIPISDPEGYFADNSEYPGSAKYILDSFLEQEYWKLYMNGESPVRDQKKQRHVPDHVFDYPWPIENKDNVSTGWCNSSC